MDQGAWWVQRVGHDRVTNSFFFSFSPFEKQCLIPHHGNQETIWSELPIKTYKANLRGN